MSTVKLSIYSPSADMWCSIYMQNCKLLELAMPNMQVLKFYFPVKGSTIAKLECLTVDTLIQVKGMEIL